MNDHENEHYYNCSNLEGDNLLWWYLSGSYLNCSEFSWAAPPDIAGQYWSGIPGDE